MIHRRVNRISAVVLLALLLPVYGCGSGSGAEDPKDPVRAWVEHTLAQYRAYEHMETEIQDLTEDVYQGLATIHTGYDIDEERQKDREKEKADLEAAREAYADALHRVPRWEITDATNPEGSWHFEVTFWYYDLTERPDAPESARGEDRYRLISREESYTLAVADLGGWVLTRIPREGRLLSLCSPPQMPAFVR